MKTAIETDNWRKKYFDGLATLEEEQRRFKALESALKRLAGRLCSAALGQSSRLDAEIKKLQTTLRRDVTSEELEKLTLPLTDAIHSLDEADRSASSIATPMASPSIAPLLDEERVRAVLAGFLGELRRDSQLLPQIDALDATLGTALEHAHLPNLLASVSDLVAQRIRNIERAKQEIEQLLGHMAGKLDEIGQFVAEQNRSQSESHASSETLNIQLVDAMKAMGESVDTANDVQQIRLQVRSRLDSIDRHLQEFRRREATLTNEMQARNEQMRTRIAQLETQAHRLQEQLQDERHLSTRDALTKIPNRLAYEKRIDEEMKRWQRFKQPTCLAVWDVDHFKRINDTYGHRAGDRVLRTVAECLSARIRGTDFVARFGGEEFVMILPGTTLDDALRVVESIRIAITQINFHFRGTPVSVTISSGVTGLLPNDSAGSAFDRADKALYRAKQDGRDRCVAAR